MGPAHVTAPGPPYGGGVAPRGSETRLVDATRDTREATTHMHAELIPGDLPAEHDERREVLELIVATRDILDLDRGEHEPGQVGLEPRVGGVDRHPQLLEHLVPVGCPDQLRQPRVLEGLPDLVGVVRHGRCDLHPSAGEHAVDGVVDGIRVVAQRGRIRGLHEPRGQHCPPADVAGHDRHHHHPGVCDSGQPRLLPADQLAVEAADGGPEAVVDPTEELLLARLGDEAAIEAVDGLEDVAVVAPGKELAEPVELGVHLLLARLGEPLHLAYQRIRDGEEADPVGQGTLHGGDDGRGIDLQHATGLERLEPRTLVGNRGEHVEDGSPCAGVHCLGGRRDSTDQLAGLDHRHAGGGEVALVEDGEVLDGDDPQVFDGADHAGVGDAVVGQHRAHLVRGGRCGIRHGGRGIRNRSGGWGVRSIGLRGGIVCHVLIPFVDGEEDVLLAELVQLRWSE